MIAFLVDLIGHFAIGIEHNAPESLVVGSPDFRFGRQCFAGGDRREDCTGWSNGHQDSGGRKRARRPGADHSKLASNLSISD
jgi:hypothetical protein